MGGDPGGRTGIKAPPSGVRDQRAAERINMKPIIIKTYPVEESKCELVRLQKDANRIVTQLQRERNLRKSYIVSEIIRQAAPYVEFHTEGVVLDGNKDAEF